MIHTAEAWLARNGYRVTLLHPAIPGSARWALWKVTHEDPEGWWRGLPLGQFYRFYDAYTFAREDARRRKEQQ